MSTETQRVLKFTNLPSNTTSINIVASGQCSPLSEVVILNETSGKSYSSTSTEGGNFSIPVKLVEGDNVLRAESGNRAVRGYTTLSPVGLKEVGADNGLDAIGNILAMWRAPGEDNYTFIDWMETAGDPEYERGSTTTGVANSALVGTRTRKRTPSVWRARTPFTLRVTWSSIEVVKEDFRSSEILNPDRLGYIRSSLPIELVESSSVELTSDRYGMRVVHEKDKARPVSISYAYKVVVPRGGSINGMVSSIIDVGMEQHETGAATPTDDLEPGTWVAEPRNGAWEVEVPRSPIIAVLPASDPVYLLDGKEYADGTTTLDHLRRRISPLLPYIWGSATGRGIWGEQALTDRVYSLPPVTDLDIPTRMVVQSGGRVPAELRMMEDGTTHLAAGPGYMWFGEELFYHYGCKVSVPLRSLAVVRVRLEDLGVEAGDIVYRTTWNYNMVPHRRSGKDLYVWVGSAFANLPDGHPELSSGRPLTIDVLTAQWDSGTQEWQQHEYQGAVPADLFYVTGAVDRDALGPIVLTDNHWDSEPPILDQRFCKRQFKIEEAGLEILPYYTQ